MSYMEKQSRFQITMKILSTIDELTVKKELADKIIAVLQSIASRKKPLHFTKRLQAVIKEQLNDESITVCYSKGYSWFELKVNNRDAGINYSNALEFRLGKIGEDMVFNTESIGDINSKWHNYQERIDHLIQFKANLPEYLERHKAFMEFYQQEKEFFNTVPHPISEMIWIPSEYK